LRAGVKRKSIKDIMGKRRRYEEEEEVFPPTNFNLRTLTVKTPTQKTYLETVSKRDLTFAVGPAGTGKTFLAVSCALKSLKDKQVDKIVITRPIVEAGERLGFLPGDLQEKVNPYLRPIFDSFVSLVGMQKFQELWDRGIIEIAPLAYMRGRTLENAFIILDEAQNTTKEQMKMFLTRFGEGSKVVITGDVTQVDLPNPKDSGLIHACDVLNKIVEIGFITFNNADVIRHPLVQKIVTAYADSR
jgi:phosphate starvation-inducible PhoH-like protein